MTYKDLVKKINGPKKRNVLPEKNYGIVITYLELSRI